MKRILTRPLLVSWLVFCLFPGCGYTTKTRLPEAIKTIHVNTVGFGIPIEEIYAYEPGLEIKITDAIIRRLEQDGNLKVVGREEADAILEATLIRFDQEGVRFNIIEQVEEYRMFLTLDLYLLNGKRDAIIWHEPNFSGDTEYFVSDVRSVGRQEAAERAIDKLARNVVDRVVEDW
ncbi:MAG: hypothetical protein HYZ85_00090 [Candidatus Omnitrophica bacterium]|nr:hypothetical protein [Candidatus Omnitrophota bacterium]